MQEQRSIGHGKIHHMKKAGKSFNKKHEPTITDVMGVVQDLSVSVQDLAEAMQSGFAKVEDRFDGIDNRLDGIDNRLDGMDGRLLSLEKGQAETHRRLDSLERKQSGMLASLDETVHRSEFVKLVHRVELLEK